MQTKECKNLPVNIPETCRQDCMLQELVVTENGTYTVDGIDGYFKVKVNVPLYINYPVSLSITQPTKHEYDEGDTLDLTGVVATATFEDGTTQDVTSSCTFSPANGSTLSTPGTQTITATYVYSAEGYSTTLTATTTVTVTALVLPAKIRITTPPTKTTYDDGESISKTGMVVKAYNSDDTIWDYLGYTGGVIPNSEISISPLTSDIDQIGADSAVSVRWSSPIKLNKYLRFRTSSFDFRFTCTGDQVGAFVYDSSRGYVKYIFASPVQNDSIAEDLSGSSTTFNLTSETTYNEKTAYYNYGTIAYGTNLVEGTPSDSIGGAQSSDYAKVAWTMLYGDITKGKQTITASWPRPVDHNILTDTFDITVQQSIPQVASWSTGTDEEVSAIIDAAQAGIIDLQTYAGWAEGDVRTIPISPFTDGAGVSHAQQNMRLAISSFDDYNNCGCVMQVDFIDRLEEPSQMNMTDTSSGGYGASVMKTTTMPALVNALPEWLKSRLIEFSCPTGAGGGSCTIVQVPGNKLALRSQSEVTGSTYYSCSGEGSRLNYYAYGSGSYYRKKAISGSNGDWWYRSPYGGTETAFAIMNAVGRPEAWRATSSRGISPFGCL